MRTWRAGLVGIGIAVTAGLLASSCTDDDKGGGLVEGDGYRGVRLNAHLDYLQPDDGPGIDHGVDSFVPSEDDVSRFEEQVPQALETAGNPSGDDDVTAAELRTYFRQYTGVEATDSAGDHHRHLVVQGVCAAAKDDGTDWERGWVEVADGGTCFWDATFDLRSGNVIRFGFHGSA